MTLTATTLRELKEELDQLSRITVNLPVPWDVPFIDNVKDRNPTELHISLSREMTRVSPILFEVDKDNAD